MSGAQLDLDLGRAGRDEGFQLLELHGPEFTGAVIMLVSTLPSGAEVTGEDLRRMAGKLGIRPHHPNAWGAAINVLVRSGQLVKTGQYVQMTDPRSHARETKVYRVEDPSGAKT